MGQQKVEMLVQIWFQLHKVNGGNAKSDTEEL